MYIRVKGAIGLGVLALDRKLSTLWFLGKISYL